MIRCLLFLCLLATPSFAQQLYEVKEGNVRFFSNAPQEIIKAYSADLNGIIDFSKKTFVFKISISSFEGFNSPLQREHFNENYMETSNFPFATYTGKIIENIDLSKNENYQIRTKGKLKIHGVEQERIIVATVSVKNKVITVSSNFIVLLEDYQIKIPRVVDYKLSQEINVSMYAELKAK